MKRFSSLNEVWDFAIAREVEAHDFYLKLTHWAERPGVAKVFDDFAVDELQHKIRLEALKAGEVTLHEDEVGNLGIADSMETVEPKANTTYAGALMLAMQKEKEAVAFYTALASMAMNAQVRGTLTKLAQEEAEHRLRLEIEYDLTTF